MPYLDSKIETNKHKKACVNPVGKRLYIRDYDDKGKQRFVPWGLTCTNCGIVIKEENYQRSLTPKELKLVEVHKKIEASGFSKTNTEDLLERKQRRKTLNKLKRLQRKGQPPITPKENGLRTRISNIGKFYQLSSYQSLDSKSKRIKTVWDEKLVDQFLNLNPRPTLKELEYVSGSRQDSYFSDFKLSVIGGFGAGRRRWGWIQDPDNPGYAKYDPTAYMELLISEAERRKELMRAAIRERGGVEPIDSSPDHIPWHNPDDVKLSKAILEVGRLLEEAGTVPLHKICARLVKDLSDEVMVKKSDIERLCPPEWKPTNQPTNN